MTTIKERVMKISALEIDTDLQEKRCTTRIDGTAEDPAALEDTDSMVFATYAARSRGYNMGAADQCTRLQPYMELLADAVQVIKDATNAPPESPDWSAFEALLTRADGMLPKGDV